MRTMQSSLQAKKVALIPEADVSQTMSIKSKMFCPMLMVVLAFALLHNVLRKKHIQKR